MKLPKILSIIILFGMFSCQDDPVTPTNPPSNTSNSFTLRKDGVIYNPVQITVSLLDTDIVGIATYASPNDGVNNTYGISVKKSISAGNYILTDGESEYFSLLHSVSEDVYYGWEHGTLEVVSNDTSAKVMHCKFEMTLYSDDCVWACPEITEGEFTIHYP